MKRTSQLAALAILSACGGQAEHQSAALTSTSASSVSASIATAPHSVTVPGYRFEYRIARTDVGSIVVTRLADRSITTYPASTLSLEFADRLVSLDAEGTPGKAYRLYQAAFNRKPDQSGLGFWISAMSSGNTLDQVAAHFVDSGEFKAKYGSVDDRQFVDLVYQNVLHRSPDQPGFDYWLDAMRKGLSRPGLLSFFSESQENKDNAAPEVRHGIAFYPYGRGAGPVAASIFRQPAQLVEVAPSPEALQAAERLVLPATPMLTGYPQADSDNQTIVIQALQTEDGTFGPFPMRILGDGTLVPLGTPVATSQPPVARYDASSGVLRMDLLSIGQAHYADARWQIQKNGSFRLVAARVPVFSDYVDLLQDVFVGGKVDTHYSLVTSIQQLQTGGQGDVLMLGNTYWDFSRTGLDRYRQGPQNLLKWTGTRFEDVSTTLVEGGIPNMYQVESEKMLADFNADGRLDVVLGGNGPDGDGNTGEPTYALLSTGVQGYKVVAMPNNSGTAGRHSWVHGGAALRLYDKSSPVAFIGDFAFGPSYLVEFAKDGTATKLDGRLPPYVGHGSAAMNYYFKSADFPVSAALGVDLDNDSVDELVLGSLYSYSAAEVAPELNQIHTIVLKQDARGSFADSAPIALPNGPFPKQGCWQKADCGSLTVKQIAAADFNRDGLADLLITHHEYGPVYGSATQLLLNKGKLQFEDATAKWFGNALQFRGASYVHSYPYDLNGDGCADIVLRGDQINGAKPKLFITNCKGQIADHSASLQALMPPGSIYMHGGVPISLGGKPAILLFNMMGSAARFSAVRFKYPMPAPMGH